MQNFASKIAQIHSNPHREEDGVRENYWGNALHGNSSWLTDSEERDRVLNI